MEDDGLRAMRQLQDSARAVGEFRGTDPLKHVDQMLTHLADVYKTQLADIKVEDLVRVQANLKQTLTIRAVIRGSQPLPLV
jgi:hypothetical protein